MFLQLGLVGCFAGRGLVIRRKEVGILGAEEGVFVLKKVRESPAVASGGGTASSLRWRISAGISSRVRALFLQTRGGGFGESIIGTREVARDGEVLTERVGHYFVNGSTKHVKHRIKGVRA
jgi:hypothetical protein